ncbi:hypothetical protein D0Z07_7339 [Hyphodiscus hymeniophilus]|uniref:Uncharacterized protein n=1 Tax=Hyphodiscus hymeniophilus TaxID=353542 RepID=A0A9P6VF08_9HELO|nr:hypothetical protein D0Z07_7339 [Hyphodiscus hymeniophilus]
MRSFSTSARALFKRLGFPVESIPGSHRSAYEKFFAPGGGAEQKFGKIKSALVRSRGGNPVHQSSYNKADKAWVISVFVEGEKDKAACHIYQDGTGTKKKGDRRE